MHRLTLCGSAAQDMKRNLQQHPLQEGKEKIIDWIDRQCVAQDQKRNLLQHPLQEERENYDIMKLIVNARHKIFCTVYE